MFDGKGFYTRKSIDYHMVLDFLYTHAFNIHLDLFILVFV